MVEAKGYLMVLYTPYPLFTMVLYTQCSLLLFPAHNLLKVDILLVDTARSYELIKLLPLVELLILFHYSARYDIKLFIHTVSTIYDGSVHTV